MSDKDLDAAIEAQETKVRTLRGVKATTLRHSIFALVIRQAIALDSTHTSLVSRFANVLTHLTANRSCDSLRSSQISDAETLFKDEVKTLQKTYEGLKEAQDNTIAEVKNSGLGLMKAVKTQKAKGSDEL